MLLFRRSLCTAVQKQPPIPKIETLPRLPLKFISQLPVDDLKDKAFVTRLEQSIHHRKTNFSLDGLKQQFELLQDLYQQRDLLETKRKEVHGKFIQAETEQLKNKFKYEAITLREDIKRLQEVLTSLKEHVSSLATSVPNVLHERIPLDQPYLISEWSTDNTEVPRQKEGLSYSKFPHCEYSTGKNAWFDLMIPIKIMQMLKSNGFIQTSNPDFLRRFVAREGNITEDDYCKIYEEDIPTIDQQLQLVGGGSFASYLPYFTRFSCYPTVLPLKFVSIGRQYESYSTSNGTLPSQAQVLQFFIATKSADETNTALDDMITLYEKIYKLFGQSYKFSFTPAPSLKSSECLRVDVTQQSAFTGEFSQVANMSYFGDYISKRILFNYRVGKHYALPHILAGTVVHIPQLLQNIDVERFDLEKI